MKKKVLFIDRDGTIIKEAFDEQIDSFEKFVCVFICLYKCDHRFGLLYMNPH